ncbi:MAG: hypothetical protein KBT53_03075 [Porticoccus sp.]|nr:hypothetical protein [Porticoccus sp.]MBQ0807408.1 hypothetical protein [Porticoccus sp.]
MSTFDEFAEDLMEDAKRFYELGRDESNDTAKQAYLRASLLVSVSSLEAFTNGIVDDFIDRRQFFDINEIAFLTERNIELINGKFEIRDGLNMKRLTQRIEIIFSKFDSSKLDKTDIWWSDLMLGIKLRNKLVHPKEKTHLNDTQILNLINAALECVNNMFLAVYKRKYPAITRGANSKHDFGSAT